MGQVNLVRNINIKQLVPSLLDLTKVYQNFVSKWTMTWRIIFIFKKKSSGPRHLTQYVQKRLFSIFSVCTSRDVMSFGPAIGQIGTL